MSQSIFELENIFDQGQARSSDNPLLKWTSLLEIPDFDLFYQTGEELLHASAFKDYKNFIIVWLVFGTEAQYDLKRREKYIQWMNDLRLERFDAYLEFYAVHLEATKCFFDGQLIQSRAFNDAAFKMAQKMGFERGMARSLFHQALTYFDLEQSIKDSTVCRSV